MIIVGADPLIILPSLSKLMGSNLVPLVLKWILGTGFIAFGHPCLRGFSQCQSLKFTFNGHIPLLDVRAKMVNAGLSFFNKTFTS